MKIKFFGTGAAFTLKNYQTNIGIQHDGEWMLLDAGGDIRFALSDAGMSFKDINRLYISHLHTDHCGGLEYLGFCTYFTPGIEKINLYGNGELLRKLWENSLKGGMESVQGKMLDLSDFFEIYGIRPNADFGWSNLKFQPIQSVHIMNGYSLAPCYGLMISTPRPEMSSNPKPLKVFWTADCQFCPNQIMDFYREADFIIQDCETAPFKSGVHAHFDELSTLTPEIKKKMILVHYQDNVYVPGGNNISADWLDKAKTAGFWGFAEKGFELDFDKTIKGD